MLAGSKEKELLDSAKKKFAVERNRDQDVERELNSRQFRGAETMFKHFDISVSDGRFMEKVMSKVNADKKTRELEEK